MRTMFDFIFSGSASLGLFEKHWFKYHVIVLCGCERPRLAVLFWGFASYPCKDSPLVFWLEREHWGTEKPASRKYEGKSYSGVCLEGCSDVSIQPVITWHLCKWNVPHAMATVVDELFSTKCLPVYYSVKLPCTIFLIVSCGPLSWSLVGIHGYVGR